jgi:hypothetical protein
VVTGRLVEQWGSAKRGSKTERGVAASQYQIGGIAGRLIDGFSRCLVCCF